VTRNLAQTLTALSHALGPSGCLTDPERMTGYLTDQRQLATGRAAAILRPASVAEVQQAMRIVAGAGLALVPQGGNTGYVGGATPDSGGRQLVMSLERLNRLRAVDEIGMTLAADAGMILADAQAAATSKGLVLPLSLGSQGSCRLGGNLSTNAGGLSVLRHGMARDLVLGIEAVLPDGTLFSDMQRLRKNNAGYDLKQLFIGGEGTLGIITGVVLKLVAQPVVAATAWVALEETGALPRMLADLRRETADLASAFEYISPDALRWWGAAFDDPGLPVGAGGALLIEATSSSALVPLEEMLTACIAGWIETALASDAVVPQSEAQRARLWTLRESIPEAEKIAGGSVKFDISVPVPDIPAFVKAGRALVAAHDPGLRLSVYGHVGDGNVHFNVLVPAGEDRLSASQRIETALAPGLYDLAHGMGGSYTAEYGIGRFRATVLTERADPSRLHLMSGVRQLFDPAGVMNPGAMLPVDFVHAPLAKETAHE